MTEFTVHLANRPGQLATLTRRLSDAGVHIEALAAFSEGEIGIVKLMADDDEIARRVLSQAGLRFEEHRVVSTIVPNRPGALAGMTEALAESGVNIDAMYLLHTNGESMQFAIAVNDIDTAHQNLAI